MSFAHAKIEVNSCISSISFYIVVNFLPFALVDPGPADSSAGFGAAAAARAQPGDSGAASEGADSVTFPEVGDFDVRYVHGYGKVADVEAGMVFLDDRSGILHWKIFRGISVRPLGAKTGTGQEARGDSVTLLCPFWVKHRKGQEEKVFLVPSLYMRPPSSHTWALLCTQDELGQLQKVRGVPLSAIGGVLLVTREVGGADQTAARTARVDAFWLRWEKEARSDMSARWRQRHGSWAMARMWLRIPLLEKNLLWSLGRGTAAAPPRRPGRCPESLRSGKPSSRCGSSWRMSC